MIAEVLVLVVDQERPQRHRLKAVGADFVLDELLAQFPDLLTRGPSEDLTVEQLADRLALLTRARTLPCIPYSLRTTPGHIGNFDILRPIIPPDEVKRLDAICAALNGQYVLYHSAFTEKRDVLAGAGQYYLMTKLHSE